MLYCVSDHVLLDTSSPALFLGSTLLAGLDVHDYGTFVIIIGLLPVVIAAFRARITCPTASNMLQLLVRNR